jgi:hypothetical protein
MLDIIEIVDINQRLAYVYITIIGQLTVCCEASYQSNLLPRRFFLTEEMLTEQLNNGTQITIMNVK